MEKAIIIITYLSNSYLPFLISGLFTFSLVLFYLEDWKLSENIVIKTIQIFTFISTFFIIIVFAYYITILGDIVNYIKDNDTNVHFHGHVSVDKETGKAIAQGMNQGLSTIGSQIGLGATMVGVSTVVGKAVAKSGMPPLQKAGIIVASSVIGGIGHSAISSMNRRSVYEENITPTTSLSNTNINSHINKLIDDSHISPLQELFFDGEIINYTCLTIVYILTIQLIFKLYFKDTINLKSFKSLDDNFRMKLEFYFNKIIKLNKQMSIVWIWFGLVVIMFALGLNAYIINDISINLDSYINIHNKFNIHIIENINVINRFKDIKYLLTNLQIINYISIISLILLNLFIIFKFHLNKSISNIFVWLMLVILLFTLALSAYIFGDLYSHINDYVNTYINLRNK